MVINENSIDSSSTSLFFIGKRTESYGEPEQQDTLWMLENFANPTQPAPAILGQEWFNSFDNKMYVCTNESLQTFEKVGKAVVSSTAPTNNLEVGETWYNTVDGRLYAYNGTGWTVIGPTSSVPLTVQTSAYLATVTTDGTPTELPVNGVANNYLVIPTNTSWLFEVNLIGRVNEANSESIAIKFKGELERANAGVVTISGVSTEIFNITNTLANTVGATVAADIVNNALNVTVVGQTGKTIKWNAFVTLTMVTIP